MSMRIYSAVLAALFTLAACGSHASDAVTATGGVDSAKATEDTGDIVCARAGSDAFARRCTVEREVGPQGLVLTVRQPGGAFRRLLVTKDGRGVIAADGAERAQVRILGTDEIEVALGGDRYRLPATIAAAPAIP